MPEIASTGYIAAPVTSTGSIARWLTTIRASSAVAMADGPDAALPLLEDLVADPALRTSHRAWAVRADLHRRRGDSAAAIADCNRALELADNQAERRCLTAARHRLAHEHLMPAFRKSPPELVALFGQLALLAGDADRTQMFGYPVCVLGGNMFMGLHEESLILRLPEADRAEFLSRYGAAVFEPIPGRPMKEYVVIPDSLVYDDAIGEWVRKSCAYAGQRPAKKPRKKG